MGNRKRDRKSAAGAAADGGREPGRFSARRKSETILRLLRGQPLDSAARELGVTAATLAQRPSGGSSSWRAARPPRRSMEGSTPQLPSGPRSMATAAKLRARHKVSVSHILQDHSLGERAKGRITCSLVR